MLALLAGCATPPPPEALPYRFAIGSFNDSRPPEQTATDTPFPFDQTTFMRSLQQAMPYALFGSEDARLNLSLTHYEATHYATSYAVSMVMDMTGTDQHGRTVAAQPLMCSAVQHRGFELADYAQQVWSDKNLNALTPAAREQTMWQQVFATCVRNLAEQFGKTLVASQTARKDVR